MWLSLVVISKALVGCHNILILGKSPIKWRQHPDMTLAVDWDVKNQFKQTNKYNHEPNTLLSLNNAVKVQFESLQDDSSRCKQHTFRFFGHQG